MPVLKTNKNGEWIDIATSHSHAHTISDIADLPNNFLEEFELLKQMVGTESVASQLSSALQTSLTVLTQAEYDKLVSSNAVQTNTTYMIVSDNA